jgi:5'-deoxynucleotidase YfbR-like HD superfamily hydrolase
MNEVPLPSGVAIENETVPFELIHEIFLRGPYGVWFPFARERYSLFDLADSGKIRCSQLGVRFNLFRPSGVSPEEWIGLFGADVDSFEHAHLVHLQTRSFLAGCANPSSPWKGEVSPEARFSYQEQEILLLAGVVHDWGESYLGDKPQPSKTAEDEVQEVFAFELVFKTLFSERQNPLFWKKLGQVMDFLGNKESKLGQAFNAIERLGYLRTGLIAWRAGQKAKADKEEAFKEIEGYRHLVREEIFGGPIEPMSERLKLELIGNLYWLTAEVLANHLPVLVDYAKIYPPVLKYLHKMRPFITKAFNLMPDSTFARFEGAEQVSKKARFEEAKERWFEFLNIMSNHE